MQLFLAYAADVIGIIGVFLLLLAYYLLNVGKLKAMSWYYPLLNFFGSLFIFYSLLFAWNIAAAMIEIAWMLISIVGFYRVYSQFKVPPV